MIRNERDGELVVECNECGTELYGGSEDFRDFIQSLKDDGWKIRSEDGDWCHYCPECN